MHPVANPLQRAPVEKQCYLCEYALDFGLNPNVQGRADSALATALDVRKFEIELYWKRATYFWAFITLTLGAYFTVLLAKVDQNQQWQRQEALLILSCLGLVFSVCWYFVNRASKFWQENWEKHVDLLENAKQGPLYKTVLNARNASFFRLWDPYPFSVSKLNQTLSLFIVLLFIVLLNATLVRYYGSRWSDDRFAKTILLMTVLALLTLFFAGQTGKRNSLVRAWRRETKIVLGQSSRPPNPAPSNSKDNLG